MSKKQDIKDKSSEGYRAEKVGDGEAVNGLIEQFIGRTGARGEITQAKVKVLSGPNQGRSMRRNIKGPIKTGDLITLRETEIEARKIRGGQVRSA